MGAKNTGPKACRRCGKAAELCGYTEGRIKIGDWICLDCIRRRAEERVAAKKGKPVEVVREHVAEVIAEPEIELPPFPVELEPETFPPNASVEPHRSKEEKALDALGLKIVSGLNTQKAYRPKPVRAAKEKRSPEYYEKHAARSRALRAEKKAARQAHSE